MKPIPTSPELFRQNRDRLRARLPQKSLVLAQANDVMTSNADGTLGYHPNADLFYLSGIIQEDSMLVLAPDAFDEKLREVLFIRHADEHTLIWEGHKHSREEAAKLSGITTVKWLSEFPKVWHGLMCESETVFLNSNEHPRSNFEFVSRDLRFARECRERYPLHQYRRLAPLMHELRAVKSPAEVDLVRSACELTKLAFERVLGFVTPGVNEAEVEAEFAHEFIRHRAQFAYPPIIGAGMNNCVLHYNQNDQVCKKGDLLLMDVAAGYGQYMSDLTRTIPINGKFTRRQRQVYNAVLRVFREMIPELKPGKLIRDLRKQTNDLIERECVELGLLKPADIKKQNPEKPAVQKYFMHGIGHPVGLDVHDVHLIDQPLQSGWIMAFEPAIYIAEEGFGIRLENTFLITDTGNIDLMATIPIEADEIEARMQG